LKKLFSLPTFFSMSEQKVDNVQEEKVDARMPVSADDNEYLKIYARIRKIMPWEPNKKAIKFTDKHIEANSGKQRNQKNSYEFSKVFDPSRNNKDCFDQICKPMASQVLAGFNAVLIAYGQTGSGKTHSLLGKPKRNVMGILPMVMGFFLEKDVTVTLGAVEAFGHHVNKIELFDLFNDNCQSRSWGEKFCKTSLGEQEMVWVAPESHQHAAELVAKAQKASHYAPTGKNPESSRGHISFIVKVRQEIKEECQTIQSYFVIVDLAGSEGETAFTPEFKRKVDPSTLMARRLEAGVINTGLSQLQIIFNELKVKRRLSGMRGVGLRRVLHPYINTKCVLAVLFCISPSKINQRATVATLKFAVQAGMVKVKPVKEAVRTNWALLVKGLKEMISNLNNDIDDRENTIKEQEKEIQRLLDAEKDEGVKPTIRQRGRGKGPHMRTRSQLPDKLVTMLGEAQEDVARVNEDEFDEKDRADVDEDEIDKQLDLELNKQRGEKEAVAAVLGIEQEEAIRKSTIFQGGSPFRESQLYRDSHARESNKQRGEKEAVAAVLGIEKEEAIRKSIFQGGSPFREMQLHRDSHARESRPARESNQLSLPNAVVNQDKKPVDASTNISFDDNSHTNLVVNVNMNTGIDYEKDYMPTDDMNRDQLVERTEVLESMLEAEKALNESYLYSQQVIIDHLAETNEGLLQFFRVKFKLLDRRKKDTGKTKRKKKKKEKI